MQTAKNAFLFPSRTYIRKAFEAYFTYLIEFIWGKRRILEVYLNVIEMGSGVYGVEAASQRYFGKSAAQLSQREAALIASVLPNPRKWSPAKPSDYIQRKASTIQARMAGVALP
jgi:monofunctional biosynthetic peptidoglycan transglycosylase